MKVRRYFAQDVRTALRKVREEQGADVVIVSNRKVEGGVELVTAEDFNPSAWSAAHPRLPGASVASPVGGSNPTPMPMPTPTPGARHVEREAAGPELLWTREPLIEQMREELRSLRTLLEQQLSGLAWGNLGYHHPLWASVLRKLVQLGLSPTVARAIMQDVPETGDSDSAWQRALGILALRIPIAGDILESRGGVVALVGPTGVGKTTLAAKLGARFALEHGPDQVGLVTIDNRRVGTFDHLRGFGRIIGVPVWTATSRAELESVLQTAATRKLIVIDTAGLSRGSDAHSQQLELLAGCALEVRSYLVLAAPTLALGLDRIIASFGHARPAGCMITKLDEALSLGPALSAAIEHALPVAYLSEGQRIPDDLRVAQAHQLVSLSVKMLGESIRRIEDLHIEPALTGDALRALS